MSPESSAPAEPRQIEPAPVDRRGFPLLALFLLTAFCAGLAGVVAPVVRAFRAEQIGGRDAFWATLIGAAVGLLVGMIIGLFQRRPLAGLVWGAPTGLVLGAIIGPLTLLPRTEANSLFASAVGGSVLLILFALATCRSAKKSK